jgi:pilus assembly protein CpaB
MSGKTKILALMLLGLGLVFMVMAFLSGQNIREGGETIKAELERFPVVISTAEIPFGQAVTADMLKVEKFAIAPAGAYREINQVIGKKPQFNIGAGLPVTTQYFEAGAVAAEVREGYRAFALRLDENNVATGKIKAGDFVDVFSIFKANTQDVEQTISRLIMPKLRVLSVGSQLVNAPESANKEEKDQNNRQVRLRAMMVEAPLADINTLAIAQTQGELFVVLRSPDDEELPNTSIYPQADTVLKPVPVKKPGDDPKAKPEIPTDLTASDKAFAGTSISNTVLPGSGNTKENKKPDDSKNRAASAPPTVEIIRGAETTRERAR